MLIWQFMLCLSSDSLPRHAAKAEVQHLVDEEWSRALLRLPQAEEVNWSSSETPSKAIASPFPPCIQRFVLISKKDVQKAKGIQDLGCQGSSPTDSSFP